MINIVLLFQLFFQSKYFLKDSTTCRPVQIYQHKIIPLSKCLINVSYPSVLSSSIIQVSYQWIYLFILLQGMKNNKNN